MGWLTGYDYRKPIPITGEAGAGTDYQVRLEVHPGAGGDGNGVVYLSNHGADFPRDIRFTDDDGITELDHWLEEFDIENNQAIFWIEIADDLGSNQSFYIYYGKIGAASDSDGGATFPFFDDFEDPALDVAKWDLEQGAVRIEDVLVGSGDMGGRNYPAAQYYSGTFNRTYFVYLNNNWKVKIRYYDHDSEVLSDPVTIHTYASLDSHDTPAILITASGKILVFYGHQNTSLLVKTSTNAEDISAWGGAVTVEAAGNPTYRQPILLPNGDVWVFYDYEVSGTHGTMSYKVSDDDGATWGARVTLVDFGDGWYIYFNVINGGNTIHLALTRMSQPANVIDNVYYIYSPDNGTTWKNRAGDVKAKPIDSTEADLVFDTAPGERSITVDIQLDGSNNPYIAFLDDYAGDPVDARIAFYDAGWETHLVCTLDKTAGGLTGGIVIDESDVMAVYVGIEVGGILEIQKWVSGDGGDNWAKSADVTTGSTYHNRHAKVVKGFDPSFKLLWVGERYYTSATNYDAFLLSDCAEALTRSLELENTTGAIGVIEGKTDFSPPKVYAVRAFSSLRAWRGGEVCGARKENDSNERAGWWYGEAAPVHQAKFVTRRAGVNELTATIALGDVVAWIEYKVIWGGADDAKAYADDVLKATHNTRVTGQTCRALLWEGPDTDTGVNLIDWFYVREYIDPEPVVGTAGAEEEAEARVPPRGPAYGLDPMIF